MYRSKKTVLVETRFYIPKTSATSGEAAPTREKTTPETAETEEEDEEEDEEEEEEEAAETAAAGANANLKPRRHRTISSSKNSFAAALATDSSPSCTRLRSTSPAISLTSSSFFSLSFFSLLSSKEAEVGRTEGEDDEVEEEEEEELEGSSFVFVSETRDVKISGLVAPAAFVLAAS
jgi:hypothetical protein